MLFPRLSKKSLLGVLSGALLTLTAAPQAHAEDPILIDPGALPDQLGPVVIEKHLIKPAPGVVLVPSAVPQVNSDAAKRMRERMRRDKQAQQNHRNRHAPAAPAAPKSSKRKKRGGFTIRIGKKKYRIPGKVDIRVNVHHKHGRRSARPTRPAPRQPRHTAPVPAPTPGRSGIVRRRAAVVKLYSPAATDLADNGNQSGTDGIAWTFHWSNVVGAQAYELVVRAPGSNRDEIQQVTTQPFYKFKTDGYVANDMRKGWTYQVRALVQGRWTAWTVGRFDVAVATR